MWTISRPDVGDIDAQLDAALVHKDGTVVYALTANERDSIHALYAAYDVLEGEPDPALMPPGLDHCKNALHAAYGQVQKGGRLAGLRGALLAAVVECPLCGFAPASTLDHHLPKDEYRALSIYPRNLVPSCQPCNRAKGTLQPVAGEGMIHAYFQQLPDEAFLHADVDYNDGVLVVSFRIESAALEAPLLERLRFQFDRLSLNARYSDPINVFLFNLKPAFKMFRGMPNSQDLMRSFLVRSAMDYETDFGLNHWRVALMRGLSACEAFLADPWSYLDRGLLEVRVPYPAEPPTTP
ncbi:HNH endonuclease [Methylocystis parvus]|uniref:HNH endonuclease n=1 Tax=Methylocystis parvus TaxID=134 RepID=UPI003C7958AB